MTLGPQRISLRRPHPGPFGWVVQLVGYVVILMAIGLAFTIVGIPIAFFMGVGGMMFVNIGRGWATAVCPFCGKKAAIPPTSENMTCKKCRQFTIVDWS